MISIATLQQQLQQYYTLAFHRDPVLVERLLQVVHWQCLRIQTAHADLFNQTEHQAIAQFFLTKMYNAYCINDLMSQLEKAAREQVKLERFVSQQVMKTAQLGLELGILTLALDQELAQFCIQQQLAVNSESMQLAFTHTQQFNQRRHQLALLQQLSDALQELSRSFIILAGLKLAHGAAKRRGYLSLLTYLSDGLTIMRQLPSTSQFFQPFIDHELKLIGHIENTHTTSANTPSEHQ